MLVLAPEVYTEPDEKESERRRQNDLEDEGERARLLAHTVYEAVGLIDEILLEAATAQVRASEAEGGNSVATDPLSLAPEILQRRRQLWQALMEREQLD